MPRADLSVDVVVDDDRWEGVFPPARIDDALNAISDQGLPRARGGAVALCLTNDAAVHEMNATWRAKDQPTNVLSFPAADFPAQPDVPAPLGDVAMAFETVHGEAAAYGVEPAQHATHLLVHGILHLFGYDHEDDTGADEMEQIERRVMAALHLRDPYDYLRAAPDDLDPAAVAE